MNGLRQGPGRRPWRESLLPGPHGMRYLPYGHADMNAANMLSLALTVQPGLLTEPLRELLQTGALVVLDVPPGPSLVMPILLPMVDLLLVVLLVDATSIAQIPSIESGRAYGLRGAPVDPRRIGFVLNQLDLRTRLGRATVEAASRHLGDRLLGVVYRDENVAEAIAAQKLIAAQAQDGKAAQDIAALATAVARRLRNLPA
jgi:cellulose biosynthesis protein BcsQ